MTKCIHGISIMYNVIIVKSIKGFELVNGFQKGI